ncbi:MAG: 30S ribosomal protein S25e [Sulfolobales archaeon]|nr:30S ribosomal protein S25e [Sulfolobales archaeon]
MSAKAKKQKGEVKEERAQVTQRIALIEVEALLKRLEKDLDKEAFKYLTPYSLAQQYNIKISLAKKLLRTAVEKDLLKLYSGGRRAPIYIAASFKEPVDK